MCILWIWVSVVSSWFEGRLFRAEVRTVSASVSRFALVILRR